MERHHLVKIFFHPVLQFMTKKQPAKLVTFTAASGLLCIKC